MGRSSHFTSGSGGSLAPVLTGLLAEPVSCDVVNTAQEAPRQTARSATEWARIVCLDMWLTSFPNLPIYLLRFYPGNDGSDDELLAPPVGVQVGAAAGIARGHAATHRDQILASISFHDIIRRPRASIVLIMNMKNRRGDGVVGNAGNRIRKPIASWPVHRRGMNTAADLAAELLCQPPQADRSHAMSHHENL